MHLLKVLDSLGIVKIPLYLYGWWLPPVRFTAQDQMQIFNPSVQLPGECLPFFVEQLRRRFAYTSHCTRNESDFIF